jgi:DNA-3-methyladenine glycosylase II
MTHYFVYSDDELAALASKDRKLARAMERIGRIERQTQPDLFTALVDSIVGQQISNKAAISIRQRLEALCGVITPQAISDLPEAEIQKCGMSFRKAGYIKSAAEAVLAGQLNLSELALMADDEAIAALVKLPGIGIWTAEMLLIFSLQRKRVFSFGDFAIKRGLCKLYGHKEMPRERFEKYRKRFAPYESIASLYLWHLAGEVTVS